MEFSNRGDIIKKLIPSLSLKERQEILAYYTVYEKYSKEFSERATEDLRSHPVFGKLINSMTKEMQEANNKISMTLQKDAIVNDKWQPYIEYQIKQGITYAKMGLDFKSWYEVISLVRNYLNPYLTKEYGTGEKFLSALNGMNTFMDIAMGIIGEAYMQEKKEIIREDAQRIKKLNEELEQKVIERTGQLESIVSQLEEYKYFFINSHDFACIANMDGYFVTINPQFEKVLGYSEKELLENQFLKFIHPDDIAATLQEVEKLKSGALTLNFINRYRKKDGSYIWMEWSTYPDVVAGKQYAIARDITERKKTEEQLLSVNKELEAFTYSVSHDLRAPLRAVNGYAEMLNEDFGPKLDEEGKRIIDNIAYNATKMGILIDDLLAFSRLGRKDLNKKLIDMNELIEGVLNDVNKAHPNTANINVKKLHNVKADYGLLHQAMYNLVSNAIKYSSKKKSSIVDISSEENGDEVVFTIKDNGVGFDMKYSDKLFGVFQRLHSQEEFEGTGVGLAIVQRVIAKHNGRVWAEGAVNEGATFNFSLTNN